VLAGGAELAGGAGPTGDAGRRCRATGGAPPPGHSGRCAAEHNGRGEGRGTGALPKALRGGRRSGYDTYLSRCHSPCESINRSPMFGCNGSCYVFVLVYMSYSILFYLVLPKSQRSRLKIQYSRVVYGRPQRF
jgi:hypothetical protein